MKAIQSLFNKAKGINFKLVKKRCIKLELLIIVKLWQLVRKGNILKLKLSVKVKLWLLVRIKLELLIKRVKIKLESLQDLLESWHVIRILYFGFLRGTHKAK